MSNLDTTEDQSKPRAEHVHTEACEHRLVNSEVAGAFECYSCGPGVRDQYCPNACPVALSEVLAASEQVTCNGSGLVEDGDAPTSEFNFRGPHDAIGEPPPKPCPGCVNCAKVLADQPKPRVFPQGSFEPEGVEAVTDEDGFRWIRAGRATRIQHYWRRAGLGVMGNLVPWTRLNRRPLTETVA